MFWFIECLRDLFLGVKKKTIRKAAALVVFSLLACSVSAYVISHNRVLYVPPRLNGTVSPLVEAESFVKVIKPQNLTIPTPLVQALIDCRASGGASGYQGGYDDACDWMRSLLGIKTSPFRSANISSSYVPTQETVTQLCFKVQVGGYVALNASEYRMEYWHDWRSIWPQRAPDALYNLTIRRGDVWRVYQDHHTVSRSSLVGVESGLTYEDMANATGD